MPVTANASEFSEDAILISSCIIAPETVKKLGVQKRDEIKSNHLCVADNCISPVC